MSSEKQFEEECIIPFNETPSLDLSTVEETSPDGNGIADDDIDNNDNNDNNDDSDEEWDGKASENPERIYAREIRPYNSDATDNYYDDGDSSGYSSDEFEYWISKRRAKKNKNKRRKTKENTNKNKKKRSQKLRCRLRFRDIKPIPMPNDDEKRYILSNIKSANFNCLGHYQGLESWSAAEVLLCKLLQCILWDCNFRYTLLQHQFVAVFSVAGINMTALLDQLSQLTEDYDTMVALDKKGVNYRKEFCIHNITFMKTGGFLLADVMGLGKTISSIAGAILRNHVMKLQSYREKEQVINTTEKKSTNTTTSKKSYGRTKRQKRTFAARLPTLIAGPNDAVLDQWEETLILSGVDYKRIKSYKFDDDTVLANVDDFILLTRYAMMSEMRNLFETKTSNLFPHISIPFLTQLQNVYDSTTGKGTNRAGPPVRRKGETGADCTRRLVQQFMFKIARQPLFRTFLIDEAHFLKNLESYWGMFAACIGAVTDTTVPITGTPYNNTNQDMATLMTFIDPSLPSAQREWWDKATKDTLAADHVVENVQEWRKNYVIRREKSVLADELTKKIVNLTPIGCYKSELDTYNYYERIFMHANRSFRSLFEESRNPITRRRQMEIFSIIMACLSCMRMSLIHPMIPGGRELTVKFSPSRRNSPVVRAAINACLKEECVVCEHFPTEQQTISEETMKDMAEGNSETDALNDDNVNIDDIDLDGGKRIRKGKRYCTKSKLVQVPAEFCKCSETCFQHYVHESCIPELLDRCPRCDDLGKRLCFNDSCAPLPTHCANVEAIPGTKGFQSTSKIEKVIEWIKKVPHGEKAILYSFFKSSLDIFEGILIDDCDIECARFDGDMEPIHRSRELRKFKESDTCHVLLATVQSSGTGLNIIEANHVGFIDRWFNPCVHDQAEDRCHRIKQKRDVHVEYFDVSMTVDQTMKVINDMKKMNGTILLADGSSIGAQNGRMGWQELSGAIGLLMREMSTERHLFFMENPNERLNELTDQEIKKMMNPPKKQEVDERNYAELQENTTIPRSMPHPSLNETDTRAGVVQSSILDHDSSDSDATIECLNERTFSDHEDNDNLLGPQYENENTSSENVVLRVAGIINNSTVSRLHNDSKKQCTSPSHSESDDELPDPTPFRVESMYKNDQCTLPTRTNDAKCALDNNIMSASAKLESATDKTCILSTASSDSDDDDDLLSPGKYTFKSRRGNKPSVDKTGNN